MLTNGYRTLLAGCGLLGMLVGCNKGMLYPTMDDVRDLAGYEADRLKAHGADMARQHTAMSPEAKAAIAASREQFTEDMAKIDTKVEEMQGRLAQALERAASMATRVAGLGDGADAIRAMVAGNQTDIDNADTAARDAANAARVADANAARADDAADEARALAEKVQTALANLSTETRGALAAATKETVGKLESFKDNRAEFDRVLANDLKLSSEQMKELEGMTTTEIIALIGAAGVGVAGGRGGPSRSKGEVEELKRSLGTMKAEIERAKPPLAE